MESRFGIQVKEVRKKDKGKSMREGQEEMQGDGARDFGAEGAYNLSSHQWVYT